MGDKNTEAMKHTTDYDIFGEITSNREVNAKHVRKLVAEIERKNLLHVNPILVNEQMQVIDGQHRLAAARILGVPIYYLQDTGIQKEDIALLNSNKKNWNAMDYINYHGAEKRPGFDVLAKFIIQNPLMQVSTVIKLLNPDGKRNSDHIREGRIDVSNLPQAIAIAGFCKWLRNYYDAAYEDRIVSAIRKIFDADGFDEEQLVAKIEGQPRSLVPVINAKQALEMFTEIYNYNQKKNLIKP